jgi:biopolymer transport protein ExbD
MPIGKARFKIADYKVQATKASSGRDRTIGQVALSLTSMVDMFAILVIFLLTNTSTVEQWLQIGHQIDLPKAAYTGAPPKGAAVEVATDGIFVDGKPAATPADTRRGRGAIEAVTKALKASAPASGYVTVAAHTAVPFGVVRRVVASCRKAGFDRVNLAVQPK